MWNSLRRQAPDSKGFRGSRHKALNSSRRRRSARAATPPPKIRSRIDLSAAGSEWQWRRRPAGWQPGPRLRRPKNLAAVSVAASDSRFLLTQVFNKKLRHAIEDVEARGAIADTVAAIGVDQELGVFLGVDEFLLEGHRVRKMHIVITCGVRDEQLAFQSCRKIHRRRIAIAFRIVLRRAHVALGINRVVA